MGGYFAWNNQTDTSNWKTYDANIGRGNLYRFNFKYPDETCDVSQPSRSFIDIMISCGDSANIGISNVHLRFPEDIQVSVNAVEPVDKDYGEITGSNYSELSGKQSLESVYVNRDKDEAMWIYVTGPAQVERAPESLIKFSYNTKIKGTPVSKKDIALIRKILSTITFSY